jgi:hypothetical protein
VVRIRPAPRSEPLTDDERRATGGLAHAVVPGRVLPPDLATGVRVRRPERPRGKPGHSAGETGVAPETVMAVVTAPLHTPPPGAAPDARYPGAEIVSVVAPGLGPSFGRDTAEPARAGELRLAAKRLLGTCIEVMGGFRPVAQLRLYCAPERFDAIANRLLRPSGTGRGHGATRASVVLGRYAPPKSGRPARIAPQDRVTVRRVQVCDVADGVAELAVVMARRGKVWAMAMRLESNRGRWLCTHMEVL